MEAFVFMSGTVLNGNVAGRMPLSYRVSYITRFYFNEGGLHQEFTSQISEEPESFQAFKVDE